MRFKIVQTPQIPPGGWVWIDSETHALFKDITFLGLCRKVERFYVARGRTFNNELIQQAVLSQMFYVLPKGFVECDDPEQKRVRNALGHGISAEMLIAASNAFFTFLKDGGKFVEKEVASARSNVCKGCPFNQNLKGCACSPFYKILNSSLPEDKKDAELGVCTACGCSLQLKTNMPANVVEAANAVSSIVYPPWCWQFKNKNG